MTDREIPRLVAVETTNRCNARCVFCPNSILRRDRQTMEQDLFEKIVDDCAQFDLPAIEPFLNGEPFMDPNLLSRLEHIRRRLPRTQLRLYTNGYALTPERQKAISEFGLAHLFISLNTLEPTKYKVTTGLSLKRTLNNLYHLANHPKRSRIASELTVRMTLLPETTQQEQIEFVDFCRKLQARPFLATLYNYKGDIGSGLPAPNFPCANITRVDILASGRVALCCMDQEGEYAWGDVRSESVLDVYNNTAARKTKQMHRTGRRREYVPCNVCNYCSPSYENTHWVRRIRFRLERSRYWNRHHPRGVVVAG